MADEIRTQPTAAHQKDLADAVAYAIHATLAESKNYGDFYLQVGPQKRELGLSFGNEPGSGGMSSCQFECLVEDSNQQELPAGDEGQYEEWQDVLVVEVRYVRRRRVQ